jgi:hypothetical protein
MFLEFLIIIVMLSAIFMLRDRLRNAYEEGRQDGLFEARILRYKHDEYVKQMESEAYNFPTSREKQYLKTDKEGKGFFRC